VSLEDGDSRGVADDGIRDEDFEGGAVEAKEADSGAMKEKGGAVGAEFGASETGREIEKVEAVISPDGDVVLEGEEDGVVVGGDAVRGAEGLETGGEVFGERMVGEFGAVVALEEAELIVGADVEAVSGRIVRDGEVEAAGGWAVVRPGAAVELEEGLLAGEVEAAVGGLDDARDLSGRGEVAVTEVARDGATEFAGGEGQGE